VSRDETIKGRFARLREAVHLEREARELDNQWRAEAQRSHDERHRQRELEKARRTGRKPLDAAAIAAAAVAIADAQGLDEVSMRKIAAVLGWGTMSLYHYVRTKEDLLAAMDDIIMGEILVAPHELKGGWRNGITAIARHTRDAYRRHPWALTIQSGGGQPGINGLRHVEQSLAALRATGLSFDDKLALIVIVDDFVFGHSLRATGSDFTDAQAEGAMDEIVAYMEAHLDPKEFPALMETVGDAPLIEFVRKMTKAMRPDEWFDAGLESILDGLAKRFGIKDAP
jgi:AcrR family transcriptional regulator